MHAYDLDLCEYAIANVRHHLGDARFAAHVRSTVPEAVDAYHFQAGELADPPRLLLSGAELLDLEKVFEGEHHSLNREWEAYRPLHRRYVRTIGEVREGISRVEAEAWSAACAGFAQRLEGERVRLADGIGVVRAWVTQLRLLLRAMGAVHYLPRPQGRQPTPSSPGNGGESGSPGSDRSPSPDLLPYIEMLRKAIAEHGRAAKADRLVKAAEVNRKWGRKALRWLEAHGEYSGFTRRPRNR